MLHALQRLFYLILISSLNWLPQFTREVKELSVVGRAQKVNAFPEFVISAPDLASHFILNSRLPAQLESSPCLLPVTSNLGS